MPTVLHVLPHPGGGAETYIDLLEGLEGYTHQRVPLSLTRSRRRGVRSVIARRRGIVRSSREFDLVHVHGDMAAMIMAPALRGRPLLVTAQGLHRLRRSTGARAWLLRQRLDAAIAASVRTICSAEDERQDLASALPAELHNRLVVVPNGVPVAAPTSAEQRSEARRSLGLTDDQVVVLFAARLEERKDPLGAATAAEAARARGADVVLLIAGGGPLEAEVLARESAAVRPLGHREDVEILYSAADLFLLPSHREGMSFALLEAMAHGLAPIVADGAGNAETVADAGVVFPAGQPGAMAERIAELAADPARRALLGTAARERLRGELSVERFLAGTREQYEAVLGRPVAPQGA